MDLVMKMMLLKDDVSLHEATIMIIWDASEEHYGGNQKYKGSYSRGLSK